MWNPFRKKPALRPSFADMARRDRAEGALRALADSDPNGRVQILVALANTKINYEVYRSFVKKKQGRDITVDEFIRQMEDTLDRTTDDIGRRRIMWFLMATMIFSLGDGAGDAEVEDSLAQVYLLLADASEFALDVLRHNMIWNDTEKSFFADRHMASRKSVLLLYMPKRLHRLPRVKVYAKDNDIWLS